MKSHRRVRISTLLPPGALPLGALLPRVPPSRALPLVALLGGLGLALMTTACQTAPVRVWRGAGHFSAGTDALVAGQGARAVAELEQAAELVPGASEIRNHLGLAYLAEGREREAREAFASAIALDCGNWAARQNLEALSPMPPTGANTTTRSPTEEDAQHGG
jgi:hypothetical protein